MRATALVVGAAGIERGIDCIGNRDLDHAAAAAGQREAGSRGCRRRTHRGGDDSRAVFADGRHRGDRALSP
jgi:hypothetical protein